MKITKAVIPAAGLGTRVLPASKAVPKEMLNIVDKPDWAQSVTVDASGNLVFTPKIKGLIITFR